MRNHFAQRLYEIGKEDTRICVVVADLSPAGGMDNFRKEFPERFLNVGVSEQVMIGFCAGLALRGFRPFAYSIATFSAYRPFEMIRDDLCYQNLPVTVVGMGAGIISSTLGGTHHAQEDIAVLSAVPNLSVIAPCDPLELADATRYCALESSGPNYLRIGKAGEAIFTEKALEPFKFGKIRYIKRGKDVCVISSGHVMDLAAQVSTELNTQGSDTSLVSCHTLKPFDSVGIAQALKNHKHVVVLEEHSRIGGLAVRVKEVAWDVQAKCRLDTFSLKDEFIHLYGSHKDLRKAHGLDLELIMQQLVK